MTITSKIIGAAIEVHKSLGAGLLKSAYQACLAHEFMLQSMPFEKEKEVPVQYKGVLVETVYRLDFLVAGKVVIELKAVDQIEDIHKAQILTYLKLTKYKIGLLINFNVRILHGIRRFVL